MAPLRLANEAGGQAHSQSVNRPSEDDLHCESMTMEEVAGGC